MTEGTRITVKSDSPTGIASSAHGSSVNALGFNIDFIASKDPKLAIAVMTLYEQAKNISADDLPHPDEDYSLAIKQLGDLFN